MSIPIKPTTIKTINRFPELYKRQAMQVIQQEKSDAIRTTADCFVMASLLALVEEFDFGTAKHSTKIRRYIKRLQEVIDVNSDFYDEAVAEGLHNKLHALGIEYNLKG